MIAQHHQRSKKGVVQLLERIMETSATVNRSMDALIKIEKQKRKLEDADADLLQRVLNTPLKKWQLRK